MSDEFDEFMKDPYQEEMGGSTFTAIAKAKIMRAYQGYNAALDGYKIFPYSAKEDSIQARENCAEYCQSGAYPQPGILTLVYGDDVPSHPEGVMSDWHDFVPTFHSRDKYTGQVDVNGEFPYDLVLAGLKANRNAFNQIQWCELSRPIDNVREPGRDKENSKYAHRVYVIKRVFKDREEAYEAAGVDIESAGDDFADFGGAESDEGSLSQYALDNGWSLAALQAQSQQIHNEITKAITGDNTPDGKPLDQKAAREFICGNYVIEVADLELLELLEEVPF